MAKALNLFPPGVKKLVDLAFLSQGRERDLNGKPIMDLTPGEMVGSGLGFTPKRIRDAKDAERIAARSEQLRKDEVSKFNATLADLIVDDQNFDAVKHQLNEKARNDPNV